MPHQGTLEEMLLKRQQAQQAASGLPPGLPLPTLPQQMTPQERAIFTKDTGIAPNPNARDIQLPADLMSLEELLRRAAQIPTEMPR